MLGKFLSMLAVLDTALGHPALQHGWLQYKRMVKAHRNEPDRFGVSLEAVRNLETVLLKLEDTVVTGRLLDRYSTVQYSSVQYSTVQREQHLAGEGGGEAGLEHGALPLVAQPQLVLGYTSVFYYEHEERISLFTPSVRSGCCAVCPRTLHREP